VDTLLLSAVTDMGVIFQYIDLNGYFYNIHRPFLIDERIALIAVLDYDILDAGGVQQV
jgi:hypothetical protein